MKTRFTFNVYKLDGNVPALLTTVPNVPIMSAWLAAQYVAHTLKLGTLNTVASSRFGGTFFATSKDRFLLMRQPTN